MNSNPFARPASAQAASDGAAYDEIDAYVAGQMGRLNLPGASLAIVQGNEVVHLRWSTPTTLC